MCLRRSQQWGQRDCAPSQALLLAAACRWAAQEMEVARASNADARAQLQAAEQELAGLQAELENGEAELSSIAVRGCCQMMSKHMEGSDARRASLRC